MSRGEPRCEERVERAAAARSSPQHLDCDFFVHLKLSKLTDPLFVCHKINRVLASEIAKNIAIHLPNNLTASERRCCIHSVLSAQLMQGWTRTYSTRIHSFQRAHTAKRPSTGGDRPNGNASMHSSEQTNGQPDPVSASLILRCSCRSRRRRITKLLLVLLLTCVEFCFACLEINSWLLPTP